MMKRKIIFVMLLCIVMTTKAQVVINEIMQSNIDCIMDDLNDFPDSWVELYNAGTTTVNLSEYSLSDNSDAAQAWQLPNATLAPKAYQLVYCDKVGDGWHTHFRLESGADCMLYLFKGTEMVDQLPSGMVKQPAPNVAYGRQTDGSEEWGYQLTATPGAQNSGEICTNKEILGCPVFNTQGRIFKKGQSIRLSISLPEDAPEGTVIRYTDDGTEPTAQSKLYTATLSIQNSTVIRAKLFCKGWLSPRSVTHSYLCFDRDVTLPVVSVTTNSSYFFDSKIGIYVEGNYGGGKKNYEYNWRRPINFEYFGDNLKASELNQLCEVRITGGASRGNQLKSLGFYANKRFGEKYFNYEFFPDQRPGIKDFKSIMMRNAGNDFDYLYMRDAVIQRIMAANVDIDWQAWSPAILFLNGEYKGILNIRERSNENNVYSNYNGLADIDMVENWYELKEGSMDTWRDFEAFYNEHGHSWEEFDEIMYVQEFMDVMIMNLFFCNLDFPGNNIVWWRPKAEGGRWRVIVKDTDFGLGLYGRDVDYKVFQWLYNPNYDSGNAWANHYEHTRLFRRLMEDETFYREFIDRFAIYVGDFMNYTRTWEIWEPMYEKIKYEYPYHRELINRWWPKYADELKNAQDWLKARVDKIYAQLNSYYEVGTPRTLLINKSLRKEEREGISVTFNGVKLSRATFDGMFYQGRQVTLQGENVAAWEVAEFRSSGQTIHTYDGNTCSFKMPADCNAVLITSKTISTGISSAANANSTPTTIYNASGLRQNSLTKGLNIVRTKDGTKKMLVK